jgi:glycosyltransferase involved in cell wall biosynthesis
MPKILRITTVPISLNILLKGQLRYMREQGFEVITASAAGPEVKEITDREGVKHFPIAFTRTISPMKDLVALWQLVRLMQREKPDIVHSHTPKAGLLGMMAAKICSIPVRLHTVAGMPLMEATGITSKILRCTEKVTYASATKVYPNSFRLKEYMTSQFSQYTTKFSIIGEGSSNGINTDYFSKSSVASSEVAQVSDGLNLLENAIVFIFVGRLVEDKGIHELVEAFLSLPEQAVLLLVGAFEDEREPVSAAIKREILQHPRIKHAGFQKDIRPFLALSDIFVFPSYREGFPNVVLQAAAMELPCIVSDINGCNEIIKEGFNGRLIPTKQKEALREAMLELLLNEDKRIAMAKNARPTVLEKYDQNYVWGKILEEYRSFS